MEKVSIEIEAKLDKATKGVEDLTKQIQELKVAQVEQAKELTKATKDVEKAQKDTSKAVKLVGKGFKGVGLAMKATGIAIVLALFNKLSEAMMRNQKVADIVETIFTTVGIVFKEISDRLISVFTAVSDATGGFDALQKVIGGSLTIAINSIVIVIQGIILGVKKAQLAWEESFFGDENPETIKRLNSEIEAVGTKIDETAEKIKGGGKQIADNFVEAVGEVGSLVEAVAEETANAIEEIDIKQAYSNAEKVVQNKKNYGLLESMSARLIEQYDLEAESQRQIRDDVSLSLADRIKANVELGNILKRQSAEEKKAIQARIDAVNEQIKLEGESNELTKEAYDLQTELLAIDAKVAGFKSEQLTNETGLKQEQLDLDKSIIENKNALAISEANFVAETQQNELAKLYAKQEAWELEKEIELERLQFNIDNTTAGTQAQADAEAELLAKQQAFGQEKMTLDKAIADQKILQTNLMLDAVINSAGAETKVGRALFIAKQALALRELIMKAKNVISTTTMNAAESGGELAKGGAKAASSLPPPFNLIPIAMFAVQAVGIIGSIRKAMQGTKQAVASAGASAGGGGSVPSAPSIGGGGGGQSVPPAFNVIGSSGTNQLAGAIGGQSQQPIKSYVVSGDVSTAQEMDRNIINESSI